MATSRKKTTAGSADASSIESFEDAMQELEKVVTAMESGELNLQVSLENFERGIALSRQCQKMLEDAELKVKQLSGDGDNESLTDFNED